MRLLIFIINLLLYTACGQQAAYEPRHLTKLTDDELIERIVGGRDPYTADIVYKNQRGDLVSNNIVVQMLSSPNEYSLDFYADADREIQEAVIRPFRVADSLFMERVTERFAAQRTPPPPPTVNINCDSTAQLLAAAFERDQAVRLGGTGDMESIDRYNLGLVLSIFEQCGEPTVEQVGTQGLQAIWFIIQHAPEGYRERYFPLVEKWVQQGSLRKGMYALMQDRMLMDRGEPQIYGSQIVNNKLYELRDPECVDQRRAEMDLPPLAEYVQLFDLTFTVPQTCIVENK